MFEHTDALVVAAELNAVIGHPIMASQRRVYMYLDNFHREERKEKNMFDFAGTMELFLAVRALFTRAAIGFVGFLIVYKFLLPLLFRSRKVDPILVIGVIYLLLLLSLRGKMVLGW